MTRLESCSEPSMEEILASIRKIIAEDPPGHRGLPGSNVKSITQPRPLLDRAMFLRDAPGRLEPSFDTPERNDAEMAQPTDRIEERHSRTDNSFSEISANSSSADPSSDEVATQTAMRQPQSRPDLVTNSVSSLLERGDDVQSPAARIEAQISDLLADDVYDQAHTTAETDATFAASDFSSDPNQSTTVSEQLLSELSNVSSSLAASLDRSATEDASPRFTMTRDGYVPEASAQQLENNDTAPVNEPFNLDLGVSPFAQRAPERITQTHDEAPFADLGRNVFRRRDVLEPVPAFDQRETSSSYETTHDDEEAASQTFQPASAYATQPEPIFATPSIVAAPNVNATLPPVSSYSEASQARVSSYKKPENSSFVSGISDAVTSDATPTRPSTQYVAVQVLENPVMLEVMDSPQAVHPMTVRDHQTEVNSAPLTTAANANLPRSMEDTVADLLRPLLKVWLAENMPKIIERALLREISDITKSEHKAAAE
jgi:cell pole-organizing protein PopZ